MSVDVVLSADEMTTASKYVGIFDAAPVLASSGGKNWFLQNAARTVALPASSRKRVGMRIKSSLASDRNFFQFLNVESQNELTLVVLTTGAIRLDGNVGSSATATGVIQANVEHFVELDCPTSNTATVVLFVDGLQVFSGTMDTLPANASGITAMALMNSSSVIHVRDIYCLSVDGTAPESRIGPGRSVTLRPNGAGTNNQWARDTVAGDASSYTEVNEADPDDDTSYVKSATVGEKDDYAYGNLPGTAGTIGAVAQFMRARKDDAATRLIRLLQRSSGGTEVQGADKAMAETYGWFWEGWDTDADAVPWTRALVDSSKFGRIVNT